MTCTKNIYNYMNLKDEETMIGIAYDLKGISEDNLEERLKFYLELRPRALKFIQASIDDIIQELTKQIRKEKIKKLSFLNK